jgi:hypothetical protein
MISAAACAVARVLFTFATALCRGPLFTASRWTSVRDSADTQSTASSSVFDSDNLLRRYHTVFPIETGTHAMAQGLVMGSEAEIVDRRPQAIQAASLRAPELHDYGDQRLNQAVVNVLPMNVLIPAANIFHDFG